MAQVEDIVCLLLLVVTADDDGDKNLTFVICLITINFSEVRLTSNMSYD
jgi:hypothetical protein